MAKRTKQRNQFTQDDPHFADFGDKDPSVRQMMWDNRNRHLQQADEATKEKDWISAIQLLLNAATQHGRLGYGTAPEQWTYELAGAMSGRKKPLHPVEFDGTAYSVDQDDPESFSLEIPYLHGTERKTVRVEEQTGFPIYQIHTRAIPPGDIPFRKAQEAVPDAYLVYMITAFPDPDGPDAFYMVVIDSKGKVTRLEAATRYGKFEKS